MDLVADSNITANIEAMFQFSAGKKKQETL
jgi:hypothetical protein